MSKSQNKWETFSNIFSQYLNCKQCETLRKNRKRWICLVKVNPPIIFGPIRKNIVKLFVDNPSHELPYSVLWGTYERRKRWICRVKPVPSIIFGQAQQVSCHVFTQSQSHYREVLRWEIFMEQELRFGQDMGQMANFPAFIASKSFDLWNHHIGTSNGRKVEPFGPYPAQISIPVP